MIGRTGSLRGVSDGRASSRVRVEEAVREPASQAGFRQHLVVADEDVADGHVSRRGEKMSDARGVF